MRNASYNLQQRYSSQQDNNKEYNNNMACPITVMANAPGLSNVIRIKPFQDEGYRGTYPATYTNKPDVGALHQHRIKLGDWFKNHKMPIKVATTDKQLQAIMTFVKQDYQHSYKGVEFGENERYIKNSLNLYSEDDEGNVIGTLSLVIDGEYGLPDEMHYADAIEKYRDTGNKVLQIGRFVIDDKYKKSNLGRMYFEMPYLVPFVIGYDIVIAMVKETSMNMYIKRYGATVLTPKTGETFGCDCDHAVLAWVLAESKPTFVTRHDRKPKAPTKLNKTTYLPEGWDCYAQSFASIQTHFQREMQLEAVANLTGEIADFGCGSAKLVPFLAEKPDVVSYTGIDYSGEMLKIANWLIAQLTQPGFTTWEGKIEDYQGKTFDSAVSINSYYSWPEPQKILTHISALLKPGGVFVLATPNNEVDMPAMVKEAKKDLLTHPNWLTFSQMNLDFMNNESAKLIDMDDLIVQCHTAGFKVKSSHQTFFLGGLNFLVLRKGS